MSAFLAKSVILPIVLSLESLLQKVLTGLNETFLFLIYKNKEYSETSALFMYYNTFFTDFITNVSEKIIEMSRRYFGKSMIINIT